MDTLPLLVIVYLVGMLCAIVIHSAGRAFRGVPVPSPLSALARASVWPLGVLMALAGIVAGLPIALGSWFGQWMRSEVQAEVQANAGKYSSNASFKMPVSPFPAPVAGSRLVTPAQIHKAGCVPGMCDVTCSAAAVMPLSKSPSAPSPEWPSAAPASATCTPNTGKSTSQIGASSTSPPSPTDPTSAASSSSGTTASQSPDTNSASA